MRIRQLAALAYLTLLAPLTSPVALEGQILERVKESAEEEAERQVRDEVERRVADLFRCVWNDLACIRGAEEDGEDVALTDEDGNVLYDEEGRPVSDPAEAEALVAGRQEATTVGTVEMVVDGSTWTFDVREGPVRGGFSTGWNQQPRAGRMVLGAGLHGWHRDSDAQIQISVGVWRETLEHMCDPFTNQVRFSPADERASGGRLRPDGNPSETCPPRPDVMNSGLAVHLNLTEASFDEEAGTLQVAGTFSGPLGRDDDAMQVEGRFEATLRSYEELGG